MTDETKIPLHFTKALFEKHKVIYKIFRDIFDKTIRCALIVSSDTQKDSVLSEEKKLSEYGKVAFKEYSTTFPNSNDIVGKVKRFVTFDKNGFVVFVLHNQNNPSLVFSLYDQKDAIEMLANVLQQFEKKDADIIIDTLKTA